MLEGVLEEIERISPFSGNALDRVEHHAAITLQDIVEEDLHMVQLLLILHLEPVSHAGVALCISKGRHRQIEIS
jgi:hypothetical protein